jgi:RNA polymerase sigma factor (sigma-70 family)
MSVHAREMVDAITAGDVSGLRSAFDQYAQDLYAYCQSRLTGPAGPAEAADALQDVFIITSAKVSQLRQPERLRAWLFAVARNECHRRLRVAARSAPLYEAAAETADEAAPAVAGAPAGRSALVSAALAALPPGEREVCELNLRHDLYGADLGEVLGVPRDQAQALASRARARFGVSLAILLAAGSGPDLCPDLTASLGGRGATLTGLRTARARRHIERCPVCRERMYRDLSPGVMLGLLPVPGLPAGLRGRIVRSAADAAPDEVARRGQVARRAEPFGAGGFPVQRTVPSGTRWQAVHVLAAVTAAVALAVLGGGMFYVDYASAHAGPPATTASTPRAGSRAMALDPPVYVPSAKPAAAPRGSSAPALIPSANGSTVPSPLRTVPGAAPSRPPAHPAHPAPPAHASPAPSHSSPVPTTPGTGTSVPTTPGPGTSDPTTGVPATPPTSPATTTLPVPALTSLPFGAKLSA